MSCFVLSNTSMYKDRASFDEINKRSFSHGSVSKMTPDKTGEPNVKSSRQETQYPVSGRALRSEEKETMEETTVVSECHPKAGN